MASTAGSTPSVDSKLETLEKRTAAAVAIAADEEKAKTATFEDFYYYCYCVSWHRTTVVDSVFVVSHPSGTTRNCETLPKGRSVATSLVEISAASSAKRVE
jgi:hypothetical protein